MNTTAVFLLLCVGLLIVEARVESRCDQRDLDNCKEYKKYAEDIEHAIINYNREDKPKELEEVCGHVEGVETCMKVNNCTAKLTVARWVNATKYLCSDAAKKIYLKNIKCYNEVKKDGTLRNCDPAGGAVLNKDMTDKKKCESFDVHLKCAKRAYKEHCDDEATNTIMEANRLIGDLLLPGPEYCTLGGAPLHLSIWLMLAAFLLLQSL